MFSRVTWGKSARNTKRHTLLEDAEELVERVVAAVAVVEVDEKAPIVRVWAALDDGASDQEALQDLVRLVFALGCVRLQEGECTDAYD